MRVELTRMSDSEEDEEEAQQQQRDGSDEQKKVEEREKAKDDGGGRGWGGAGDGANAGWGGGGAAWGIDANTGTETGTWGSMTGGGGIWGGGDDSGGDKGGEVSNSGAWGGGGWGEPDDGGGGGTNAGGWGGGISPGVGGEIAEGAANTTGKGIGVRGEGTNVTRKTGEWGSAIEDERRSSIVEAGRSDSGLCRGVNRGIRQGFNGRGQGLGRGHGRGRGWAGGQGHTIAAMGTGQDSANGGRWGVSYPVPSKIAQVAAPPVVHQAVPEAPTTPAWGNNGGGSWGTANASPGTWGGWHTAETSSGSSGGWGGGGWGSPAAKPDSEPAQAASPPQNTSYNSASISNVWGATSHSVDVEKDFDAEHSPPLRTPPPSANLPSKPGFNAFTPSPVQDKAGSRALEPVPPRATWNTSAPPPTYPRSFAGVPTQPRGFNGTPTGPRQADPLSNHLITSTVEDKTLKGRGKSIWEQPGVGGHVYQAGLGGSGGEALGGAGRGVGTGVNAGVQDKGWGSHHRSALQGGIVHEKPAHPDSPVDDASSSGRRGLPYGAIQTAGLTYPSADGSFAIGEDVSARVDVEDGHHDGWVVSPTLERRPLPQAYSPDLCKEGSRSGSQDVEMDESCVAPSRHSRESSMEVAELLGQGVDDTNPTATVKSLSGLMLVDALSGEEKIAAYGEGLRSVFCFLCLTDPNSSLKANSLPLSSVSLRVPSLATLLFGLRRPSSHNITSSSTSSPRQMTTSSMAESKQPGSQPSKKRCIARSVTLTAVSPIWLIVL